MEALSFCQRVQMKRFFHMHMLVTPVPFSSSSPLPFLSFGPSCKAYKPHGEICYCFLAQGIVYISC